MFSEVGYYLLICAMSFVLGRLAMKVKVIRLINKTMEEKPIQHGLQYSEGIKYACNEIYKGLYSWLFTI